MEKLDLTEKDFELIQNALEHLPNRNVGTQIMQTVLGSLIAGNDPEKRKALKDEFARNDKHDELNKKQLIEEIRILQGKLIQLQRYLRMNDLLKDAKDVL